MYPHIMRLLMGLLGSAGAHKGLGWLLKRNLMQGPKMGRVASALRSTPAQFAAGIGGFEAGHILGGSLFDQGEGPSMNETSEQAITEQMNLMNRQPPSVEDLMRIIQDQQAQGLI